MTISRCLQQQSRFWISHPANSESFREKNLAARIYTDKHVDLRWLKGKTCAVIGFGAQGRAHALNLRDSGISVIVGLYPGSKSRVRARRSGLEVLDTAEAVRRADIIFLALSDRQMPVIYAEQIAPSLRPDQPCFSRMGLQFITARLSRAKMSML